MRLEIPDSEVSTLRELVRMGADKAIADIIAGANSLLAAMRDQPCEPQGYDCVCEADDSRQERQSER